jgi:hypothetical protein
MENKTEEHTPYLEVRMPMTCNETLCAGNDVSYEVRKIFSSGGLYSYVSRIDVRQVFGRRPEMGSAFIVQENPPTTHGVFLIKKYDYCHYRPGELSKTVGISFTSKAAHKFACKLALKSARKSARREGLSKIVDKIEEDKSCLRQDIEELHNQALEKN